MSLIRRKAALWIEAPSAAPGPQSGAPAHPQVSMSLKRSAQNRDRAMYVREPTCTGIVYADPQIERITGYTPAQWEDESLLERILHPEDRERVLGEVAKAQASGAALSIVYRMHRPDQGVVWVRDASELIEDDGRVRRRGFLYDITAKREDEIARERQARLAFGLIDAALDGMCLTDRHGHIVLANTRMRTLAKELHLPEQGTAGERLRAIADRLTDPADSELIERIVSKPEARLTHEFEFSDRGRSFQGFISPVETSEGEYLGRIWTIHETTEERQLDRLRRSFTASVSHELRTPLTSILGYLELLRESLAGLEPTQDRYLSVIDRNANRLLHLVNDLLFVAQIQAGNFEIEPLEMDPAELARAAVESARPAALAKQIDLRLRDGATRPIFGDPVRLGQALDNLVSNAVKFTREGGNVVVSAEVTEGRCALTVIDDGIGIPKAEQARLFDRFFRSSNASDNVIPGTGLGLTIARAIVEAHGGTIDLESSPNAGTLARISIPAGEPPSKPSKSSRPTSPSADQR
jgi:PAS domain S-box-containing protein